MGGGHKALLALRGRPLIEHVRTRLQPQCAGLALSVNEPGAFAALGLPLVEDPAALKLAGPLAGILAGLDYVAMQQAHLEWVVSAPADAPFLPADLVARLVATRVTEKAEIVCARLRWPRASGCRAVAAQRQGHVAQRSDRADGSRRVDRFTARHRTAVVEWSAVPRDPFFNINEPSDLEAAEAMAGG